MQTPHTHWEMLFSEFIYHFGLDFIARSFARIITPIRRHTRKKALRQIVKNRNEASVFIQSRQRSCSDLLEPSLKSCMYRTGDTYLESLFQSNLEFLEHDTRLFFLWNISPAVFKENPTLFNKVGNLGPFHLHT